MHDLGVLLTFAGGLAGALVLGFLAHRLKLSPIVGYLLAGVLVGPFAPGFVADRAYSKHTETSSEQAPATQAPPRHCEPEEHSSPGSLSGLHSPAVRSQ